MAVKRVEKKAVIFICRNPQCSEHNKELVKSR